MIGVLKRVRTFGTEIRIKDWILYEKNVYYRYNYRLGN